MLNPLNPKPSDLVPVWARAALWRLGRRFSRASRAFVPLRRYTEPTRSRVWGIGLSTYKL